jgi:hypothetical protein
VSVLQSNEFIRGTPELVQQSALSFIGGVHIGARALHVLNLIWFGYITRQSQWGGGGAKRLHVEEGGRHPVVGTQKEAIL